MKQIILILCLFPSFMLAQDWVEMDAYPGIGRHHPVTFSINGFGYVATGSAGERAKDVFRYNSIDNTWEQLPPFSGEGRSFAYGDTYNGKGYIGFGMAFGDSFPNKLADLWEYDPATENWSALSPCPCETRTHPAFMVLKGKIYVGLGGGENGDLKDWWVYDIELDTWEQKTDFPDVPRHHPYFFAIGDYAYVGMGHGVDIYNDLYRYDPTSDAWEQMASLPAEGRVAGTQFSYEGKGYILSGQGEDHSTMDEGEFWQYDPESDTWAAMPPHPGNSRWAPGSFLIDNRLYFTSGRNSDFTSTNETMYFDLESGIVSTKNITLSNPISISPNPVRNEIRIEGLNRKHWKNTQVQIFNATGQNILIKTLKSNSLNLEFLAKGTYFLKIIEENGKVSSLVKFLKT